MLPGPEVLEAAGVADALVSVDADGRVLGVNSAFEHLLGVQAVAIVGCSFCEHFRPRDVEGNPIAGWHESSRLACVRGVPAVEVELRHPSGRLVKAAVTVAYSRRDGRFDGGVVALRDLSHRRLENAAARAVATVAHEIRAPLTGIRGFASLLLNKGGAVAEEQRREMLGQVLADAERMTRLVGELLDVSRLEAGVLSLGAVGVDVAAAVEEALLQARAGVPGAGDVDVAIDVRGVPRALADPDKVLQVLVNLMENALKYGEPPVSAHVREEGDQAIVEVRDAGMLDEETRRRLFSKYWRRGRPGRPSGTGLGLYIARGLTEAQGGTLSATSEAGVGTTFRLCLPREERSSTGV